MKALQVVITVTLFALSGIFATAKSNGLAEADLTTVTQTVDKRTLFNKLERGLVFGFGSDVTGVVESSIYNAINYKVVYPDFNSSQVTSLLNDIAVNNENHSVRYKAFLALKYYTNPSQFGEPEELLTLLDHHNQNDIFFFLQETVQTAQQLTVR